MIKQFLFTLSFCLLFTFIVQAQPSITLANKVADKMKDSLQLSASQRAHVFQINIQLSKEKMQAMRLAEHRDSITRKLQRIENNRDSLYKEVLTENQYNEYRFKKRNLVTNN